MIGWTAEELTGRKAPFEYWPESADAFAGKPGQYTLQLRRRSGELFNALVNIERTRRSLRLGRLHLSVGV